MRGPAIRLLPSCSEGSRRLSILLAALTLAGLVCLCYWLDSRANAADNAQARSTSDEIYAKAYIDCIYLKKGDQADCGREASELAYESMQRNGRSTVKGIEIGGFYLLLSLAGAYLVCLFTRSISWVRQGFEHSTAIRI